jgi:uncharacterized protein (TIGR04255 family)
LKAYLAKESMPMSEPRLDFERPPVVERVVTVVAKMDGEIYASNFDAWRTEVQAEYPIYEPVSQWLINAEIKEGELATDPRKAQLKIIPRFSKKTGKAGFDWSLRSPQGSLTMNMHSGGHLRRRYDDLRAEFSRWLSRWIEHFEVEEFQILNLTYVNVVNRDTAPDFSTEDGRLLLEKLITVFVPLPGKHQDIVPPLDCTVNLRIRPDPPATLLIHLFGVPAVPQRPTVRLDLTVETQVPSGTSREQLFEILDWCHERILNQFKIVFTEEAIKGFGPIYT